MIELKESWGLYLNLIMALIVVWSLVVGYQKGLLKGLLNLLRMIISLIVASLFSGAMARVFPLLNYRSISVANVITDALEHQGSRLIWFVILFIATYFITMIIEWLFGFVEKIPIISSVNSIAGLVLGFILAYFKLYLLLIILVTPIFRNAQPLIDNSYMSVVQDSSSMIDNFAEIVNESIVTQKASNQENLNQEEVSRLQSILSEYGLTEDQIIEYLEGLE